MKKPKKEIDRLRSELDRAKAKERELNTAAGYEPDFEAGSLEVSVPWSMAAKILEYLDAQEEKP